ncbi:DUF1566 domain-containing protein [bacterium]|nr:DUF1566 domain-containing protein [bacterium]
MKTKMFLFILVLAALFSFVSCGDETANGGQPQVKGNLMQHTEIQRVEDFEFKPLKKKEQLPKPNIQNWSQITTGQDQCFNNAIATDCANLKPKYLKQDGNMRNGTRSVVPHPEMKEVVQDEVTGLLWMKQIRENVSWYEAKLYCDSLKVGSKTWRLPTTAELRSIVNYGKVNPAIDSVFYDGDKDAISNWFWASKNVQFNSESADRSKPASAWIINFYDGFVEYTSRYNIYSVRCVADAE